MMQRTGPVLSIGEVLIDFIVADGGTSLESAETFVARAGGAPANVAVALARLGIRSAFCGVIGDDPFGSRLLRDLLAEGVDTSKVLRSAQAATTLAFAWKDVRGDGHFWLLRGADVTFSANDVAAAGIGECSALVVGSVSLAVQPARDAIHTAVNIADEQGVPVIFDVNFRPTVWTNPGEALTLCEQIARKSRIVKLSLDDAKGLYGAAISAESVIEHLLGLGSMAVVLTDGERGCWFGTQSRSQPTHVSAFPIAAIEPTGAGDAFCAALIDRMVQRNWSAVKLDDIRYAAAAGALATTKRGAWEGLPNRDQLGELVNVGDTEICVP